MTEKDVIDQLDILIFGDEGEEKIETREGRFIEVSDFIDRFRDSEVNYKSLINNSNAELGWKSIFDEWKQKGILN